MSLILSQDNDMHTLDQQARDYSQQSERFLLPIDEFEHRISSRGLAPVSDLSADQFLFLGFYIYHRHKSLTWAWADWLNIAMHRWGEYFEQLAIHFKYQDDDWLSRLARTAAFYTQDERTHEVSITHYVEATNRKLDDTTRHQLLQEAEEEKLTAGAFRDKIHEVITPLSGVGTIQVIANGYAIISLQTKTIEVDLNQGQKYIPPTEGVKVFVKYTQNEDGVCTLKELRPYQPPPTQFNYTGTAEEIARDLEHLAQAICQDHAGHRLSVSGQIQTNTPAIIDSKRQ